MTSLVVRKVINGGRIKQKLVPVGPKKLKSLPQAESYLCPGATLETLDAIANQMSDNQFAERMVNARSNLFQQISRFANRVA
ncbi:hypothetical protein ES707_13022 [subsurface metagenome]